MATLVCRASVGADGGFWFVGELRSDNRVYFKRRDGSPAIQEAAARAAARGLL